MNLLLAGLLVRLLLLLVDNDLLVLLLLLVMLKAAAVILDVLVDYLDLRVHPQNIVNKVAVDVCHLLQDPGLGVHHCKRRYQEKRGEKREEEGCYKEMHSNNSVITNLSDLPVDWWWTPAWTSPPVWWCTRTVPVSPPPLPDVFRIPFMCTWLLFDVCCC